MTSAHEQLEDIDARLARAHHDAGEAEAKAHAADAQVERARDQLRELYDLGADPTEAKEQLNLAKAEAEQAVLAAQGVAQRAKRIEAERQRFVEDNAETFLDELRGECDLAARELREFADAMLRANDKWNAMATKVSYYLRAMNLNPGLNAPGEHELAGVVRDLKRIRGDITSPAGHMRERAGWRSEDEGVRTAGAKAKRQDELEIVHG